MAPDRKPPPPPKDKGAPAYIVSMSALWTIMLSFFIMMVTLSSEQECGFIAAGTGSFAQEIGSVGLRGMLSGTRNSFTFGTRRPNYAPTEENLEPAEENEGIGDKRMLKQPDKHLQDMEKLKTRPVRMQIPIQVRFDPGGTKLNWRAVRELNFALGQIRNTPYVINIEAYVDVKASFTPAMTTSDQAWMLSTLRAATIARYFHEKGGIPTRQLVPIGYAHHRPVTDNHTDQNAAENDRVKIVIYEQ